MKKLSLLLIVICWYACSSTEEQNTLEQCNVIASKVITGEDTLIVCDQSKITQQIKLPLSTLVENWKLLILENSSKEVMVQPYKIYPSEKYLLIHPAGLGRGLMLFDKNGKYLRDISKVGNGPGEILVQSTDVQIDEGNDIVYIKDVAPSPRMLKYRLSDGAYLQDVPCSYDRFSRFIFNPQENTMIATRIPLPNNSEGGKFPILWKQDMQGNVLQEVSSVGYDRNLSCHLWLWERDGHISFFDYNLPGRKDTLFHYRLDENRLAPRFTVDFGSETPEHWYGETSDYYLVSITSGGLKLGGPAASLEKQLLVDKRTLKGAYVDIGLDGYGDFSIATEWFYFNNTYFTLVLDPILITETCEKLLAHPENLKPGEKKNLQELLDGLTEDDNAIIIYGKIK